MPPAGSIHREVQILSEALNCPSERIVALGMMKSLQFLQTQSALL